MPRQVVRCHIGEAERLADGTRHERDLSNRRQLHEGDVRRVVFRDLVSNLQGQPGLADAAGSDQCDQAHRRIREPLLQYFDVAVASEQGSGRKRQRSGAEIINAQIPGGRARTRNQGITGVALQIQRGGQRTHRFNVRPPPFAPLQGAHGLYREARNRRQLLLREAGGFAKRLQVRPKRSGSATFHGAPILMPAAAENCVGPV